MILFEHQIFDNRQPEALEEKKKIKRKKINEMFSHDFFSPQFSKWKQHKRIYSKTSHDGILSSSNIFSVKARSSLRNPTVNVEKNHNGNMSQTSLELEVWGFQAT